MKPVKYMQLIIDTVVVNLNVTVRSEVKVTQACPTLCDPMDYTVRGVLQARILVWVAVPFSRVSSPTQGLNPDLLHCRRILLPAEPRGKPYEISDYESPM